MWSKYISRIVLLLSVSLFLSLAALAQTVTISGKITIRRLNGSIIPAVGAVIDVYRTDMGTQKFQVTTDKSGAYALAGVPFIGTYAIAVSATGAKPDYRTGIKFSQQPTNDFTLVAGDGSQLTLDQIKAMVVASGQPSDANKAIEEKNRQITQENEIVARTFQAGNEALNAGRFDDAISSYREGLKARPDEPALLTNLSEALRRRGVDRFNAAVKNTEAAMKSSRMDAAKADWSEAAKDSHKALDLLKNISDAGPQLESNKIAALATYALAMRLVAAKVDQSQAPEAWAAYQRYIPATPDPAKRKALRSEALQMLLDAGATDLAITEGQKILASEPNDFTANRVVGLSLFSTGDKSKFQEALDRLQRYVELAPDSDPLKATAREAVIYLTQSEGIKPPRGRHL